MGSNFSGHSRKQWITVIAVCVIAIAAVIVFFQLTSSIRQAVLPHNPNPEQERPSSPTPGISLVVRVGEITVARTLAMPTFGLESGQSMDFHIPPGPFEADIEIAFRPGSVREAYIGAEIAGGSVIIMRDDEVLQSGFGPQEGTRVMTNLPVALTRSVERITYMFRSDDAGPVRFRAIWQPFGAAGAVLLPVVDDHIRHDQALQGMLLAQQRNCAACHHSRIPELQQELLVAPAPNLAGIGSRVQPEWLRKWLVGPRELIASSTMPQLFQLDGTDDAAIDDLIHYLMSLTGTQIPSIPSPSPEMVERGRRLYHTIGCVPCHGPFESPGDLFDTNARTGFLAGVYRPLPDLKSKTNHIALTSLLLDPLEIYPSGEMPDMSLDEHEAEAIAAYVWSRDESELADVSETNVVLDPRRIARGKVHFAELGCVNCHRIGLDDLGLPDGPQATRLEELASDADSKWAGCLSMNLNADSPYFDLMETQRTHLAAFLESLPQRRNESVPHDELALNIRRLRCTACHAFAGHEGPEPGIKAYFTSASPAPGDFGDEDRFPPALSDVGAHLTETWMSEVLGGHDRARPYLATRMPRFSESVIEHLPERFHIISGAGAERNSASFINEDRASVGRTLIGDKGFYCIRCHSLGEFPAAEFPGPDLADMPGRLRYEYFRRWVEDPRSVRRDTIMPTYFISGRSGFTQFYDGWAEQQIEAIWSYLRSVEDYPPPPGVLAPGGIMDVSDN